jgi:hypothetical protein
VLFDTLQGSPTTLASHADPLTLVHGLFSALIKARPEWFSSSLVFFDLEPLLLSGDNTMSKDYSDVEIRELGYTILDAATSTMTSHHSHGTEAFPHLRELDARGFTFVSFGGNSDERLLQRLDFTPTKWLDVTSTGCPKAAQSAYLIHGLTMKEFSLLLGWADPHHSPCSETRTLAEILAAPLKANAALLPTVHPCTHYALASLWATPTPQGIDQVVFEYDLPSLFTLQSFVDFLARQSIPWQFDLSDSTAPLLVSIHHDHAHVRHAPGSIHAPSHELPPCFANLPVRSGRYNYSEEYKAQTGSYNYQRSRPRDYEERKQRRQ